MSRGRQDVSLTQHSHPRYPWVAVWYVEGKRKRAFFKTSKEGKEFRLRKLKELAMTPGKAPVSAEEVKAVLHARDLGVPLWAAVEAYARSAPGKAQLCTAAALVQRRREAMEREGLSASYAKELRTFLRRAEAFWPETPLAEIGAESATAFVFADGGQPKTLLKRKVLLTGLFNFAASLGLMEANPARRVKTPSTSSREIALLSPEQSREYLLAVATSAPAMLAAEAIRMFAGLRRAELERLQWEHVKLQRGFIEVGAALAKTRQRRLVDIEPALAGILEGRVQPTGPVCPVNYRMLLHAAQRASGWRDDAGSRWPDNCLRHGFVSYHLAFYRDAARTELQSGHDRTTMFRYYRELVTAEEAEEFWAVQLMF